MVTRRGALHVLGLGLVGVTGCGGSKMTARAPGSPAPAPAAAPSPARKPIYAIDAQECIGCGACEEVCPVSAISAIPGTDTYVIDPAKCTGDAACVDVCPVDCIAVAAHP